MASITTIKYGTGNKSTTGTKPCVTCKGTGRVKRTAANGKKTSR